MKEFLLKGGTAIYLINLERIFYILLFVVVLCSSRRRIKIKLFKGSNYLFWDFQTNVAWLPRGLYDSIGCTFVVVVEGGTSKFQMDRDYFHF